MGTLNHVGIIPDGNRRWAVKKGLDYRTAYDISMENLLRILDSVFDYGVSTASVYLLSKDNLKRKRDDLLAVVEAEEAFISDLLPSLCKKHDCTVHIAGSEKILPETLLNSSKKLREEFGGQGKRHLYLLLGYDPIDEINSCRIQDKTFGIENLWVPHRVDCVIRTAGGATMLSNFLPLQSSYAQIYMLEMYFPDASPDDFCKILQTASQIEMKYGK